jgi:hypothetical protein
LVERLEKGRLQKLSWDTVASERRGDAFAAG